ncbi:MAG: hypothetical protein ACYCUM_08475 [Solirubrobacteraceae bacterium]
MRGDGQRPAPGGPADQRRKTMKDPLSIVLDAAQQHVNEIQYRSHSDATIARGDQITTAIRALRQPARIDVALARAQRDWLLRLIDSAAEEPADQQADEPHRSGGGDSVTGGI